jgi:hypothetical protein
LAIIKAVVKYRIERNTYATLSSDMTVEYAIKLSSLASTASGVDPDLDWIVSASASSSANGRSANNTTNNSTASFEYDANLLTQQITIKRKSSAKRLPWEDQQFQAPSLDTFNSPSSVPKVTKSREVAPLKAFPMYGDDNDFSLSSINSYGRNSSFKLSSDFKTVNF